jgi:aryl-alcohol dehydrogenase-like predicted oxidoreductase
MNERNRDALAALFERRFRLGGTQPSQLVAEWLIERGGVVVPSAMTDEDCADLFFESAGRPPAHEIRARLERIARGEEAQPGQPW